MKMKKPPSSGGFKFGRSGLERVHVQLDGAFEVGGLVLVHDVVLCKLVQHGGYLGKQGLGGALLRGAAERFHGIACRLVVKTVVGALGQRLTNSLFR